jgi:hypothetical protein
MSTNPVTTVEFAKESLGLGIPIESICSTEPIKALSSRLPSEAVYTSGGDSRALEGDGFDWYTGEEMDMVQCHIGRTKTLLPGQKYIVAVISINCSRRPVAISPEGAGAAFVTNRGIHMGDERAKVFACYGRPKERPVLAGSEERFYYSADGCSLDFEIDRDSGRVAGMMLTMTRDW